MSAEHLHPRADRRAERDILGAILVDNASIAIADAYVTSASFTDPGYALVHDAMKALVARRAGVDVVTLAAELRTMSRLNTIGGAQAIDALTTEVGDWAVTAAHIEERARIVANLAACRAMGAAGSEVARLALDPKQGADVLRDFASTEFAKAGGVRGGQDVKHHRDGLEVVTERLLRGTAPTPVGVSTGFRAIDAIIKGLAPGRVYVLAGRPAMGKSALAQQIAGVVATGVGGTKGHKAVLFFSLEMPRQEVFDRGVAQRGTIPVDRVENPSTGDEEQRAEVAAIAQEYARIPLMVRDRTPVKIGELAADARLTKLRHPDLALIVVDYLQLVQPDQKNGNNRERDVSEVCEGLKSLAKELNVPVLALAQINRGVEQREEKRPSLGDLRESGAIEQIGDVVMFIYRDEYYRPDTHDKGIAEVIVAKGRGCSTGTARLGFIPYCAQFAGLAE